MIPWRDTVFAFSALPDIAALLLSARPALIWSRDGANVLWANPAGAAQLGAGDFPALAARRWAVTHPLRRTLANLARSVPAQGTLARLRLAEGAAATVAVCRCTYIRAGGERGLLVVAENGVDLAPPSLPRLASFFTGRGASAAILDAGGNRMASGDPDAAAVPDSAPATELACEGRAFRLLIAERAVRPAPATVARAAPLPFDGPGLSAILARLGVQVATVSPELLATMPPPLPASPPVAPGSAPIGVEEPPRAARAEPEPAPAPAPVRLRPPPEPAPPERPVIERPYLERPNAERPISAGRVAQDLSRKPVRFLWQTDGADRFLFVSPGLQQVVGRNAEIVGERWQEVSDRLRLDPTGRIGAELPERDTWSGLTAWWPVEGSQVRIPAELTALPVFGADRSFQGYRGFGILRPADAIMPGMFEARFGAATAPDAPIRGEAESSVNVVPIRADLDHVVDQARLSPQERNAFEEIAAALQSRVVGVLADRVEDAEPEPVDEPPAPPESAAVEMPAPIETPFPAEADTAISAPAPRTIFVSPGDADLRGAVPRAAAGMGARLAEAQRRVGELTGILDTATDGVLILDAAGKVESVNASAEALFGLDASEILARPIDALLTPESGKAALDYLSGLRDSGVASLLNEGREVAARAGAGSIPVFMTLGRLSTDGAGRFCAVLRDITHFKRIESDLRSAKVAAEEASHQKSDFLARVSHEIRTPLNAIIGFAEVMIEERFGAIENERYRDYLRDIRTSGEHVVSLVNDLLDISKIEAGKLDLTFAAVPLNELVREAIGLMQPRANRARVVLRSSLSRDVPAIVADARTMRQIVLNLLSNSVKFTAPGGQVIASTSLSEEGEALLRIRDTGEGMSEDELARALEPFRQLSTASIADRGTGLGLPLTIALVEANRAAMSIRSARGEGTVVTITIPATRVLSE